MKKRIFSLLAIIFVSVMLTGCSFSLFFNPNNQDTIYENASTIDTSKTLDERVRQIAKDYVHAVVTIFVVDASENEISFGSGVGVYQGGYIATNYHVVSSAVGSNEYSLVVYYNEVEVGYEAEILWSNPNLDLAIIKSDNPNLPFVNMSDRFISPAEGNALEALETVVAIGTPIDFSLQNSVTLGYVASASARMAYADGNVYEDLIQHTAPINHGNSGGALFDSYGKLIGLNTLGNDEANSIFFSVPIYPVTLILEDVVTADQNNQTFTTPILGITANDRFQAQYLENNFSESGMIVNSTTVDGPSYQKLYAGDIITSLTIGSTIYHIDNRNDLIYALLHARSGNTVGLGVLRDHSNLSVNIVLD